MNSLIILGVECQIQPPNVGQLLDIQTKKEILSNGMYSQLLRTNSVQSIFALDLIDAISVFSVLTTHPELKNITNYLKLDMKSGSELVSTYRNDYAPEYKKWIEYIQDASKNLEQKMKDDKEQE